MIPTSRLNHITGIILENQKSTKTQNKNAFIDFYFERKIVKKNTPL